MAIHVLPWTVRVTLDSKVEDRPDMALLDKSGSVDPRKLRVGVKYYVVNSCIYQNHSKRRHNFGTKRFKEKSLYISCPYRAEVADTAVCTPDCARCQNRENTHTQTEQVL